MFIGDSAGGHLALALARYLRDNGKKLGLTGPKGLVLLSPWVDVGFTTAWGEGKHHHADSDLIDDTFGPFATSLLLRALPADTMHNSPYISPASLLLLSSSELLADFPPVYLVHGTAERLDTSIKIFWQRLQLARKYHGLPSSVPDRHISGKDCVHDFMIFPWQSEEAAEVYADMDVWLRELLSADESRSGSITPTFEQQPPVSSPAQADSPLVSPISPDLLPISPTWTALDRTQRRRSRQSLRSAKSPLLAPSHPGVRRMMGDMRTEAMSYLDLPGMDMISPLVLVGQVEGGEWDWDGPIGQEGTRGAEDQGDNTDRGKAWYEVAEDADLDAGVRVDATDIEENRKDR